MVKRLFSGLAVSVLTLLFAMLAIEVGLRALNVGSDTMMRPDEWTGWSHIPGRVADVPSEDPTVPERLQIRTNSLGLRDVERDTAKAEGVYRIVLLGDSFIEAQQVPLDSTVSRRLEAALNDPKSGFPALDSARAIQRVEVWNCGVSGFTTSQEYLYFLHTVSAFRPDLVVLAFLSGNDVADAVPQLATSLRNRAFFRLEADTLVLDRSFFRGDPPGVGWLRTHSRLFTWASTQRQVVRMNLMRRSAAQHTDPGLGADFQIYTDRPDSLWRAAWAINERLIIRTREEAARQGAGFLLVSISNGAQETEQARAHWPGWEEARHLPGVSLEHPESRLARLTTAHGIDYLPLLPAFREEQARTQRPLHIGWTGHWNAEGHAVAARVIAEWLVSRRGIR